MKPPPAAPTELPRMSSRARAAALALALVASAVACSSGARPGHTVVADVVAPPDASVAEGGPRAADAGVLEDPPNFTDIDAGIFLCNPYATWSIGTPAPGLPTAHVVGLTVTPDELGAAWLEDVDGSYAYRVADRADTASAFGDVQTLTLDATVAAAGGMSLSPDGLRIVFVKASKRGFLSATRGARSGAFGAPTDLEFRTINQWATALASDVADPTYGSDGRTFLYSLFNLAATIAESRALPGDDASPAWPAGAPHGEPPLGALHLPLGDGGAMETLYRHPVSLSSDGLTMFISDEYPGEPPSARAVYRTSTADKFVISSSLGTWAAVQPNSSCRRLYYVEDGGVRYSDRE